MARDPIPTWFFVLVVARLGQRYLLVHENKHGQLWYLPAGRVEPGETFVQAARRETLEEAGVPIVFDGVLRVEHSPQDDGTARVRVIFLAHPKDDTPPKSRPDAESLGASWFTWGELATLPMRGDEVLQILRYVDQAPRTYPLELIDFEGAPFVK